MVEEFDEMVRPVLGADIRLDTDGNRAQGSIEADPSQLEQVLMNLVGKAIKFSSPNGRICIEARRTLDEIEFAVRDSGVGIAKSRRDEDRGFVPRGVRRHRRCADARDRRRPRSRCATR